MYNVEKISNWDIRVNIETDKPCELYVDNLPFREKTTLRVLWVVEPNEVSGIRDEVIKRHNEFDLILSWDEDILNNCNNAVLHPFGTTWVLDFDNLIEKEYSITTLIGGKNIAPNHTLRQLLPDVKDDITNIKFDIFNSKNNPLGKIEGFKKIENSDAKNELFYSQYHIAIENITKLNWFTEKIIDCFQTKTIPIYVGCPNIGDFFDVKGILHVKNINEIVNVCNSLTPETYNEMLPHIENNYELSKPYANFRETLKNTVIKFVKESQ